MTVAYHPEFARLHYKDGAACKAIGANAALLLSQLLYWHPRATQQGNWIYKTQAQWESETGLTRIEQETSRKRLLAAGLIEEARRGEKGVLHFRLTDHFFECGFSTIQNVEKPHTAAQEADAGEGCMWKTDIPVCGKATIQNVEKPHSLIGTRPAESETTTETTTEIRRAPQDSLAREREARGPGVQAQNANTEIAPSSRPTLPPRETRQARQEREATEAEAAFWAAKTHEHGAEAVVWVKAALLADIASGKRLGNKFTIAGFKFDDWAARQAGQNQTGAGGRASPAARAEPTEAEKTAAAKQASERAAKQAKMAGIVARIAGQEGGAHGRTDGK